MRRMLLVVLAALVLASAAFGAEKPREMIVVGEDKPLAPIASLKCVPLYEIRSLRMDICRQQGDERQKLVFTAVVVQNKTDNCDLLVTLKFVSGFHIVPSDDQVRVQSTRRGEPIRVRWIKTLRAPVSDAVIKNSVLTPYVLLETTSPEEKP